MPMNTKNDLQEMKTPAEQLGITEEQWNSRVVVPQNLWLDDNQSPEMTRALLHNPLALMTPEQRRETANYLQISGENDAEFAELVQKEVAARWISNQYKLPVNMVKDGWKEVTRGIFGKEMSGSEVYTALRELRQRENQSWIKKAGGNILAGVGDIAKTGYNLAAVPMASIETTTALFNTAIFAPIEWLARKAGWQDTAEFARRQQYFKRTAAEGDTVWATAREFLENKAADVAETSEYYANIDGPARSAGEQFTLAITRNLPQLILTVAAAQAGLGNAVAPTFGITAAVNEFAETRDNDDMSYSAKVLNAIAVGGAEWLFEQNIGAGKIIRKYWNKVIPPNAEKQVSTSLAANVFRTAKSLGIDAAGEGMSEVGTGIVQRFSNLVSGKTGKELASMSAKEIAIELLEDAPMEFAVGSTIGLGLSSFGIKERYKNHKYNARMLNYQADIISIGKQRISELAAIENPTAAEVEKSEILRSAIADRNVDKIEAVLSQEYLEQLQEAENDELTMEQWKEKISSDALRQIKLEQSADLSVDEETHLQTVSREVERSLRSLGLDGNENVKITIVSKQQELPEQLQDDSARIEGAFDTENSNIYLVAENISSARIPKVLLHEVAGHLGLRKLFSGEFDRFLFSIAQTHSDEVAKVAADRNLDISNEAGLLEAAEEFVATFAENGTENTIWQRIAAAFRNFLRNLGFDLEYSDSELRSLLSRGLRNLQGSVVKDNLTPDGGVRYLAVDKQGKALFNIEGVGSLTYDKIDPTIKSTTKILTDDGRENWGFITAAIVEGAAKKNFQLEELPIRLFVGDQDFGLRHMAKHFDGLNARDISELIENIFSKPNKIYCRIDGGKIKLEVFAKPPRHWGILELRKNNDCYSIVSVYSRDNSYSEAKGELIWEYDSQSVLLQAANSKPRQITSGTMPQEAREELATQTIDNIDPLGINVNASNNKNPENSGSARHSVANDGGFRSSDPHKEELWAKFIVKIANANYINPDAAAALLLDHGIRVTPQDEQTLVAACVIARRMVRQRNDRMRKSADVKAMGKKDEFYKIIVAKYGSDFKINAGPAYDGSTFTGSFMDTRKTEKGRAKSIPAADIAKLLSNKLGREISEKNVVEHFAHLKKDTLLADIREKRRQKSELRNIEQEIEESERQRATGDEYGGDMPLPEDESPTVKAARKRFITAQAKAQKVRLEQWVAENMPQIYQWTVEFLGSNPVIKPSERFKGEHFSGSFISKAFRTYSEYTPGKKQGKALEDYRTRRENALAFADGYSSDELAKAIVNKYGGNELDVEQQIIDYFRDLKRIDIKQMYREAMRENREYEADLNKEADAESAAIRFKELLDYAEQDKINIIRFQQKAALYARRYLPENQRGRFIGEIVKLAKFDAAPSVKYPEGRRKYELEKLMRSMQNFRVVDRIDQILADLSQKVNKTGQTIGNLGDKGELFQKIKAIRAMSTLDVENRILDLREKVASITENEDGADEADAIREELALYETFGKLEQKTPDQAVEALRMLKDLRDNNKSSLLYRLQQQRQEIGKARLQAVEEIAGRKATGKDAQAAKQPWKFALEQMGLRSLLDLVTSRAVTDFDQTVFGKLFTKIENSTQHGATLQREDNDAALNILGEIFGFRNPETGKIFLLKQAEFWRSVDVIPEHTGIMIKRYKRDLAYYTDQVSGQAVTHPEMRRGLKRGKIKVKHARELLKKIDAGEVQNMEPLAVEFLRQQLSDFDLKIERDYHLFGNDDQDAAFKILISKEGTDAENEANTDLYIIMNDPEETFETVELNISKAEAANILMAWEQPDVQARMRWNGWSDESIGQLKNYLGDDWIKMAYRLRDMIKEKSVALDAAAKRIYGAGLPGIVNYFPTSYSENIGSRLGSSAADGVVGDSYGQLSINPGFLIARRFHLSEPDLHHSIFTNYFRHMNEVNHFLAFGETIREFRSVFNSRPVREAIVGSFGKDVYDQIKLRMQVIADGGARTGRLGEVMGKLFRHWIPAKLAFNVSSVMKQIAGATQYMNDVPMADFMSNYAETFSGSELYKKFVEYAQNSDYLKNRLAGGLNRDLLYLMQNNSRSGKFEDVVGNYMLEKGASWTAWADKVAALRGGYAVFKYHLEQALARNVPENEAWEFAAKKWMRATDETQQSGYLKDQNFFQSQANLYRYLTAFLSNPIQIMNLEMQTLNRLKYSDGWKSVEAKELLKRQILVNHIITPALMVMITQFMRSGTDFEEWDWTDFLTAFVLGPFNGWLVLGKIAEATLDNIGGNLPGGKKEFIGGSSFSAQPLLDDYIRSTRRGIRFIEKAAEGEAPTGKEIYGAIQSFADISTAAGSIPLPGFATVGSSGSLTSAILRELKRYYRVLIPDEPKKKSSGRRLPRI